ncbi:MAG: glycosyltransferase family 2 protein [Spirochaetes bacterium]|nr:glycosyltransferase family 2 protein [Spirochaetota bacterium]
MALYTYTLVTAAYNEEKNIEKTIRSVVSQSLLPREWLIVSDGSTDKTDAIVHSYREKYKFISFLRIPGEDKHSFASKVYALNTGIEKIDVELSDFIGILDADVSFGEHYFSDIIRRFNDSPKLGIAGGNIVESINGSLKKVIKSINSVAGAVQLYRRECFTQTGPFLPLEYGGEDAAKEIMARMKGWEVRTFPEIEVSHHGFVGGGKFYRNRYRRGIQYFLLGYHPLFHFARCIFRVRERPVFTGSLVEMIGYIYAKAKFSKSGLPADVVRFLRSEQMERLKEVLKPFGSKSVKDQVVY